MKNDPIQIDRARTLRHALTFAETRLWNALKGKKLGGFKFRRQHSIGQYIADFCCVAVKVVVELDGDAHIGRAYADRLREEYLRSCGYEVIRFENCDTKYEEGLVLGAILSLCRSRMEMDGVVAAPAPHP